MADTASGSDRALAAIRSAGLVHPDGKLPGCFLQDSVDPEQAACYMLRRCPVGGDLTPLLSDWKQLIAAFTFEGPIHQLPDKAVVADITTRDGGKCCITRLSKSFWDPLVVAPIFPRMKTRVDEVAALPQPIVLQLTDFISLCMKCLAPSLVLNCATGYSRMQRLRMPIGIIGWSASPRQRHFRKDTLSSHSNQGSKYDVGALTIGGPVLPSIMNRVPVLRFGSFGDHSASGMDTPDVSALQIRSRFAKPIRWSLVAREIAGKKPQPVTKSPLPSLWRYLEHCLTALTTAWRLVPPSIRIGAYRGLAFLGAHMYPANCSLKVQQLPFGMYLKKTSVAWHHGLANEYGALQLVRRHTHIPVPRPLDLVSDSQNSYLLTSRVPGVRLGLCIDILDDNAMEALVCDLQKCLAELRAIPKVVAPEYAIANALGGACYDHRINAAVEYDEDRGDFIGPFVSEDEFNETIRPGALPDVSHRSGHKMVFTHGDLNMRNVLMHNGRLSAVVDWENSGWYPEYWGYTKAHYITKLNRRWLGVVDDVFKAFGDFEDELATENQLWWYCF